VAVVRFTGSCFQAEERFGRARVWDFDRCGFQTTVEDSPSFWCNKAFCPSIVARWQEHRGEKGSPLRWHIGWFSRDVLCCLQPVIFFGKAKTCSELITRVMIPE
jgi:hypothetical protein